MTNRGVVVCLGMVILSSLLGWFALGKFWDTPEMQELWRQKLTIFYGTPESFFVQLGVIMCPIGLFFGLMLSCMPDTPFLLRVFFFISGVITGTVLGMVMSFLM